MKPFHEMTDSERFEHLEQLTKLLRAELGGLTPFMLFFIDSKNVAQYVSNIDLEDMLEVLHDFTSKLEAKTEDTPT